MSDGDTMAVSRVKVECDGCGSRPFVDEGPEGALRVACSCTEVSLETPEVWLNG